MTTAPVVELSFNPTDLRPRDLPTTGAFLGSPADALEAALAVIRATMIDQMRAQVRGLSDPTHAQLVRIADLAWQGVFWKFRKISAPVLADAYLRAYRQAEAGEVPVSVIYDLADKHAEKVGDYFHASSRDALAEGFNTLVNRRIPSKVAADRVLDAYGLTRRQMRGYLSANQQFNTPISDVLPRSLKARARAYIDRSFTSRTRKLSRQEEHNIDEQAKQFAWMWLQDKGRLSQKAEKMWITARDERVCPICGPLHGQKVKVGEQFVSSHGEFWTPGIHPNCRCVVRLLENTFAKAETFNPKEHPRGGDPKNRGRFSVDSRTQQKPVINLPESDIFETLPEVEEEKPIRLQPDTEPARLGGRMIRLQDKPMSLRDKPIRLQPETTSRLKSDESTRLGESIRMSPEELGNLIRLAPIQRMQLSASVEQFLLRDAQESSPLQPSVRRNKVYDRPTIWVHDVTGTRRPYYAVREEDIPFDGARYNLYHDIHFTPNLDALSDRLVDLRDEKIQSKVGELAMELEDSPAARQLGERSYSARLDEEVLSGPVKWFADGSNPQQNDRVNVAFVGPSGDEIEESLRYSDVVNMLRAEGHDLDQKDFEVSVMRLDEAHMARPGENGNTTYHNTAGAFSGQESWVTEGDYTVKRRKEKTLRTEDGHAVKVVIDYLDPEAEEIETEAPTILGGEWPPYGN